MIATITMPRLLYVGGGAIAEVATALQKLGARRPLIVSDPFMERSGLLAKLTDRLDAAGVPWRLFAETVPDPTTAVVEAGVALLKAGNYDCLIALGGGSPIDTAKAMSVLAANGGAMRDYKVPNEIPALGLPLIAIPTTAGTGSEVTRFTVITDSERDEKMLIMGVACCPAAAIVDYELTFSMPWRLTADTGIDSLTPGELGVARLAGDGLTTRQIAQALFVSAKTVSTHLGHIYGKLAINNREDLTRIMRENNRAPR